VSNEFKGLIKDLKSFTKLDVGVAIPDAGRGKECGMSWPEIAAAYVWV